MKHLRRFFWVCCVLILCVTACAKPTLPPAEHTSESAPDTSAGTSAGTSATTSTTQSTTTRYPPGTTTLMTTEYKPEPKPLRFLDHSQIQSCIGEAPWLSMPWGENQWDLFPYPEKNPDKPWYEILVKIAFGENGKMYVFDGSKEKDTKLPQLRIFRNGTLEKTIVFPIEDAYGTIRGLFPSAFAEHKGNLYMLEPNYERLYVFQEESILDILPLAWTPSSSSPGWCIAFERLDKVLPFWGNHYIRFPVPGDDQTLPHELRSIGMLARHSSLLYFDKDGNHMQYDRYNSYYGFHILYRIKPDGVMLDAYAFSDLLSSLFPNVDNTSDFLSVNVFGSDAEGRLHLFCSINDNGILAQNNAAYLIRVDFDLGEADILQIPYQSNTNKKTTFLSGFSSYLPHLLPDGTIYKSYLTDTGGVQVFRFSFDD